MYSSDGKTFVHIQPKDRDHQLVHVRTPISGCKTSAQSKLRRLMSNADVSPLEDPCLGNIQDRCECVGARMCVRGVACVSLNGCRVQCSYSQSSSADTRRS